MDPDCTVNRKVTIEFEFSIWVEPSESRVQQWLVHLTFTLKSKNSCSQEPTNLTQFRSHVVMLEGTKRNRARWFRLVYENKQFYCAFQTHLSINLHCDAVRKKNFSRHVSHGPLSHVSASLKIVYTSVSTVHAKAEHLQTFAKVKCGKKPVCFYMLSRSYQMRLEVDLLYYHQTLL